MQNDSFRCRRVLPTDQAEDVARFLHLTDPYIYPAVCQDPADEEWVALVRNCMNAERNLFHARHLSVALCGEDIVGLICVIPCGVKLDFVNGIGDLSENFMHRLSPVIDGYFAPLIAESLSYDGYNITNVCVDSRYRGKGVGSLLLAHGIEMYGHSPIHLDVIASNRSAIHLYKKFGFEIATEYDGFSGDDTKLCCYHMVRKPTTAE